MIDEFDVVEQISQKYKATDTFHRLKDYYHRAKARAEKGAIKTGFPGLDDILSGGLYSGLYIIGGETSTGKTSFILQLADTIAAAGRDVLFYSLEMSADELIARSLSRYTYKKHGSAGALSMIECYLWKSKEKTEEEVTLSLSGALDEYINTVGRKLHIIEGNSHTGANEIQAAAEAAKTTAENSIAAMDPNPVIFIDYLQLIAPEHPGQTDKQRIDTIMQDLKTLSRDLDTPVICVSSYNRGAYNKGASLDSFKESGNIEYSADVCMCLQIQGATDSESSADQATSKIIMEQEQNKMNNGQFGNIELCILKNRRGQRNVKQPLLLNNKYNIYLEPTKPDLKAQAALKTLQQRSKKQ